MIATTPKLKTLAQLVTRDGAQELTKLCSITVPNDPISDNFEIHLGTGLALLCRYPEFAPSITHVISSYLSSLARAKRFNKAATNIERIAIEMDRDHNRLSGVKESKPIEQTSALIAFRLETGSLLITKEAPEIAVRWFSKVTEVFPDSVYGRAGEITAFAIMENLYLARSAAENLTTEHGEKIKAFIDGIQTSDAKMNEELSQLLETEIESAERHENTLTYTIDAMLAMLIAQYQKVIQTGDYLTGESLIKISKIVRTQNEDETLKYPKTYSKLNMLIKEKLKGLNPGRKLMTKAVWGQRTQ